MTVQIVATTDSANDCMVSATNSQLNTGALIQGINVGFNQYGGIRFPALNVPQGATITSATLALASATNGTGTSGTSWGKWFGDAVDNAGAWTQSSRPDQITRTTAFSPVAMAPTDSAVNNHDVTAIVQEIVNRPGWQSGNAIRFGGDPTGGSGGYAQFHDYGSQPTKAATLAVSFYSGAGGTTGRGALMRAAFGRRRGAGLAGSGSLLVKRDGEGAARRSLINWLFDTVIYRGSRKRGQFYLGSRSDAQLYLGERDLF